MARWRLQSAHYLNVQGSDGVPVEWEYTEQSRLTGKQVRKRFQVPQFLDPKDPSDHNYPGEIIVCWEDKGAPQDITFFGAPTPEMEPLDAEAEAITLEESKKWVHPIDSLPGQGEMYSQSLIKEFERAIDSLTKRLDGQAVPNVPTGTIPPDAFAQLQVQVAELAEMNRALASRLAEKEAEEDPLDDPEPIPQPARAVERRA